MKLYKAFKNITLLSGLCLATSLTSFGDDSFDPEDYRTRVGLKKCVYIYNYNKGGLTSSNVSFGAELTPLPFENLPHAAKEVLAEKKINATNVEVFESYCQLLAPTSNYFTHCYFMPRMVENIAINVEIGAFEVVNLVAVNGEIGINNMVTQTQSFHDSLYLSGNGARFKPEDPLKNSEGWFLSICENKAVVIHWTFGAPLYTDEDLQEFK